MPRGSVPRAGRTDDRLLTELHEQVVQRQHAQVLHEGVMFAREVLKRLQRLGVDPNEDFAGAAALVRLRRPDVSADAGRAGAGASNGRASASSRALLNEPSSGRFAILCLPFLAGASVSR